MKKISIILLIVLFFSSSSLAQRILTVCSDSCAPCYKRNCPLLGIYIDANIGYSWLSISPYRGNTFGLLPLGIDFVRESSDSFIAALGYDLYPCAKLPMRLEFNYFYADETFQINPLYLGLDDFYSDDKILARNTMATFYFDWHTCTRFVPFIGLSAGFSNIKTYHHPHDRTNDLPFVFTTKQKNFSWGATLGTRYFFTNYFFANAQLRFNNLGKVLFRDETIDEFAFLPQLSNFQSDYLHETTVMLGAGYVF